MAKAIIKLIKEILQKLFKIKFSFSSLDINNIVKIFFFKILFKN